MKKIKVFSRDFIIRLIVYGALLFLFYSGFAMYKLSVYSDYIQNLYKENNFQGKDMQVVINLIGWPVHGIEHKRGYVLSKDNKIKYKTSYQGIMKYYTGNHFIDSLGWFPGGGCSIDLDENEKVVGFNEYLE